MRAKDEGQGERDGRENGRENYARKLSDELIALLSTTIFSPLLWEQMGPRAKEEVRRHHPAEAQLTVGRSHVAELAQGLAQQAWTAARSASVGEAAQFTPWWETQVMEK